MLGVVYRFLAKEAVSFFEETTFGFFYGGVVEVVGLEGGLGEEFAGLGEVV